MTADAIFVHAGPCKTRTALSDDAIARLKKAVDLYREGTAPVIVLASGESKVLTFTDSAIEVTGVTDAYPDLAIAYLLRRRVKPEHIRFDSRGKDTIGELYFAKISILQPESLHSLIIVTNDFHVARSRTIAERVLGSMYTLTYEPVRTVWDDEPYVSQQQTHETEALQLFEKQFTGIHGDDAFGEQLSAVNPLYTKKK